MHLIKIIEILVQLSFPVWKKCWKIKELFEREGKGES